MFNFGAGGEAATEVPSHEKLYVTGWAGPDEVYAIQMFRARGAAGRIRFFFSANR